MRLIVAVIVVAVAMSQLVACARRCVCVSVVERHDSAALLCIRLVHGSDDRLRCVRVAGPIRDGEHWTAVCGRRECRVRRLLETKFSAKRKHNFYK